MSELFFNPDADDQKLLAQVLEFYHRQLPDKPKALEYLKKRGVVAGEAIEQFQIGFSDRTLGLSLPPKYHKLGRQVRGRMTKIGILRDGSGHERYCGSVVFPIHAPDGSGRVVDVYGRKIGEKLRSGTIMDTFQGDERQGVWNIEGFGVKDEVIVCDSLFDALTLWCHGYRNVTCFFDSLNEGHFTAFAEYGIRRVMTTAESVSQQILDAGIDCFLLKLPKKLDAIQYASKFDDPAAALGALIRKAEWLGKGKQVDPLLPEPELEPPTDDPVVDEPEEDDSEFAEDVGEDELEPLIDPTEEPEPVADATPMPKPPQDVEAEYSEDDRDEVILNIGHRRYRIRGLAKNLSYDTMRVNVLVSTDRGLFVDTFDLYSARHRRQFVIQAATELTLEEKTIKKDLGRVLMKLEDLQEKQIEAALEPTNVLPTMSETEKEEALRLLRDPKLLDRIVEDIPIVGEETNKLVGYLSAVSRKLDQPLAVIIQSSSAAGKTTLMEAILSFVPPEDLHRNAQRLIRPLLVANPYAEELTFLDNKTRSRRDHLKYLTLIRAIALLHQHQRPIRTVMHEGSEVQYIEATVEDIEVANKLASEALGRSVDDLPPQTQRLLRLIESMVDAACERDGLDRSDYRFTRRDVRDFTAWGNTQLKVHLKRLEELEYLLVHRGGRGQSFVYELLHGLPTESGTKFLAGLIDVTKLDLKKSGSDAEKSALGRGQVGPKSVGGRPAKNAATASVASSLAAE